MGYLRNLIFRKPVPAVSFALWNTIDNLVLRRWLRVRQMRPAITRWTIHVIGLMDPVLFWIEDADGVSERRIAASKSDMPMTSSSFIIVVP